MTNTTLAIEGDQFIRNGLPHRIFSGALHYFRVVPEYWEDRLLRMKACGLNTVETYVAWNLHEPRPGEFDFSGILDLRRFLALAQSLGFDVIFRPGPYICAEFDFGGLPPWLLAERDLRVRSLDPRYLEAVERFFKRLFEEVGDCLAHRGGPIVAVQVENEYGSYGNNTEYVRKVEDCVLRNGVKELLFTSDGPEHSMLQGGTLTHVFKTVNFGSQATEAFKRLREYQPGQPVMCMEFWNGWFDHWGKTHHTRSAEDAAAALDELLSAGGSVNVYMMHGGTSFGYLNGANHDGRYHPTVTSYDYDAPISEHGGYTPKYHAFREVLGRHGARIEVLPPEPVTAAFGSAKITGSVRLFGDALEGQMPRVESSEIRTMEEVGQNYGFILYRTRISGPREEVSLIIQEVRDRAWIYAGGKLIGVQDRNDATPSVRITVPPEGVVLEILVGNLGRVNYGAELHDRKGITEGVRLANQFLNGWEIVSLDFTKLPRLEWQGAGAQDVPGFHRAVIEIDTPADTFLKVTGGHGTAWINGFCLGRYWEIGPQRTLYIPAPLLRQGENEIVLFEVEPGVIPAVDLVSQPVLG